MALPKDFLLFMVNKGGKNKTDPAVMVVPGGIFFDKAPLMARFKYLSSEVRKEFNKRINLEQEQTFVKVEDQRPNKKGVVYEFPAPLTEELARDYQNYDRTAVFTLEAQGNGGKEFKVEENTAFSLPPGKDKKEYFIKVITPNSVTVEYTNAAGEKKPYEIRKGNMPQMDK